MRNASRKPSHQPGDVRRVNTMELILSVTVPKVWPGAMIAGVPAPTIAWSGSSGSPVRAKSVTLAAQFGVDVADGREIRRPRPRVQLPQERIIPHAGFQLRHAAARVVEVAEDD